MKIVVTNDDGYKAAGVRALVEAVRDFGDLIVICPKSAQSGMSMAVTMGNRPIAVKKIGGDEREQWWYLDGTPASCVKYAIDNILFPERPDLVICGVNHGSNAATAAVYSGTVGAAMEGAVNGIPSIAVSLDDFSENADFSAVRALLPDVLRKLLPAFSDRYGVHYNINFPAVPASAIKGVRAAHMGAGHWEKEYQPYLERIKARGITPPEEDMQYVRNADPDEEIVVMAGDFVSEPWNAPDADHLLLEQGWITITPLAIDNTDYNELKRLCDII